MSFQSAYSLELKQHVTPKEAFDFSCSLIGTPLIITDTLLSMIGTTSISIFESLCCA